MKGIVLAGGTGSRLWPMTKSVSKQLLPVYDKPMVYYPISTLMLAGIREILIITTPHDQDLFKALLGNGSKFGVSFEYALQPEPRGLAQAFLIGEQFLGSDSCLMILGDNIFHGVGLGGDIKKILPTSGAHIFTYAVANPNDYGVLEIDSNQKPKSITEKPDCFISNMAVTGLYFFDNKVSTIARQVVPSLRNELEITSVIEKYLSYDELTYTQLSRGVAWLDTGSIKSINDASSYIRVIEERTATKIACLEEIAYRKNWINSDQLAANISEYGSTEYGRYLAGILAE